MTERDAFLRAIRANPDDDLVRLVFADWLEERGEQGAEFIRVQCELEPIRHRLENPRTRELISREEVLQDHRFGAAVELDEGLGYSDEIGYRRGLPDWLLLSLDTLLTRGEQLFAAYPTVRELAVFGIEGRGADLAACPLLAGLDVLEIADTLTDADAEALAASSHLRSISRFTLYPEWDEGDLGVRIGRRSTPDWPRRIDMVWLADGFAAGLDARECDRPVTEEQSFARQVNVAAGRELAHDVRPATRLFPLRGYPFDTDDELTLGIDTLRGMYVGRLPDETQALIAYGLEDWYLVTFEANGLVKAVERRAGPIPGATWHVSAQIEELARRWATEALGLAPAVIRVREFQGDNQLGIHLFPRWFEDYLYAPALPDPIPSDVWREKGGLLSRWLRRQDFVIDWGNDYWADWQGTIHSS
jgi:uncharacterized protein (TIGR02996 family)